MEAPAIIQEGLTTRTKVGVKGWICLACNHVMSFLGHSGGCPNCKSKNIHPIKSKERLHEETQAIKETQKFHYWQKEDFDPQSKECQTGRWLTTQQLLGIICKFIPGAVMFPQMNPHLGRTLAAFYVPHHWKPAEAAFASPTEVKGNLKFICCGEMGAMREWDYLPLDAEGRSLPYERGWRGVLGIFYRAGLIPFLPDEGTRLAWYQIKESPIKKGS